eukprot:5085781-Pyramimonas_sp.AAC.1
MILKQVGERAMADTHDQQARDELASLIERECVAITNQRATIGGVTFKADQGEFSGIRLTDCFNTLANMAMFYVVCDLWKECLNIDLLEMISKRTRIGDDLSLVSGSCGAPALVAYGLSAMGCVLNGVKQYQSAKQIEFLRRLVTSSGIFAFKNRAIGGVAAPPVQREVEDFIALRSAEILAAGEIFRRGGSALGTKRRTKYIVEWLANGYTDSAGQRLAALAVPREVSLSGCAQGGLGLFAGYHIEFDAEEHHFRRLPRVGAHLYHKFQQPPTYASSDLASLVSPHMRFMLQQLNIDIARLTNDLHKLLLQSTMPAGSKQRQLDNELVKALDGVKAGNPLKRKCARERPDVPKLVRVPWQGWRKSDLRSGAIDVATLEQWQQAVIVDRAWCAPCLIVEHAADAMSRLR